MLIAMQYITANSWYRPAQILDNGENWRDSNEGELRPLNFARY